MEVSTGVPLTVLRSLSVESASEITCWTTESPDILITISKIANTGGATTVFVLGEAPCALGATCAGGVADFTPVYCTSGQKGLALPPARTVYAPTFIMSAMLRRRPGIQEPCC